MDTSPAINTFLCKTKHRDSRGRPGRSFRSRVRHREYGDTPHTARIGPLTLASRRVLEDATWSVSSVRSASPVRLIERRNGRACHANYERHRRWKERTAASKRNRERERAQRGCKGAFRIIANEFLWQRSKHILFAMRHDAKNNCIRSLHYA